MNRYEIAARILRLSAEASDLSGDDYWKNLYELKRLAVELALLCQDEK